MQKSPEQFGIEEIPQILQVEEVSQIIQGLLQNALVELEVDEGEAQELADLCIEFGKRAVNVANYEEEAHRLFIGQGLEAPIQKRLTDRAHLIKEQILPHLVPGTVLDLGCGDGQVGHLLSKEGFRVQLADVYEHPKARETGLLYTVQNEGEPLHDIEDNHFDNVLLAMVLHHSDDPDFLLKEAERVVKPGGKVILIESVYGVDDHKDHPDAEFWTRLTAIQQRFSNVFFDHFYNRILHYSFDPDKKVNVPCNFDTPGGWRERTEAIGLTQNKSIQLGLDHEIVPEWHTLDELTKPHESEPHPDIEQIDSYDDYQQKVEQLEEEGYEYDGYIDIGSLDEELELYRAERVFNFVVLPQFMDGEKSDEFVEIWVPFDNKEY
ncbi:class I SAM-dependent methyltransferase [Patescibacteria group bacterium]